MSGMFELDPEYLKIRDEALEVAAAVDPIAFEADDSSTLHPGIVAALRSSALTQLMVPASHGGRFDKIDPLAICVAREALMATCAQLDAVFALQGLGSYAITAAGSEAQRDEWLPQVAQVKALAALALTEPNAGSDLRAISTTLLERDGSLHINGEKSFISNAGVADFYTLLAREGDGFSAVLVPAITAGLTVEASPELIAPHVLGEVTLNDVQLPAAARLGPAGSGFQPILATLAVFRVSVAGAAVGLVAIGIQERWNSACTYQRTHCCLPRSLR